MARKWSNRNLPGALHYVTGNVLNRLPIFRSDYACRAFLEECQQLRADRECKLIAFVVMPDHFHLIANPRDGKIREWIGALKSLTGKRLLEISPNLLRPFAHDDSHRQAWQESFRALPLWSDWMIWQKINYIHSNPVRAKLVGSARDYRWTSFHAFYQEELEPLLQIDRDWWWPEDVQKLESAMAEWDQELEEKIALKKERRRRG
jgi:REP-associated tyrosine transposase